MTGLSATRTIDEFFDLRNPFCISSASWSTFVQSQEAGVAAHDLDEEEALVRCGRVADFVDTLHDGVQGRVIADGGVGAVEVVVDRAGKADDGEVKLVGKNACAGERTVAADDHEGVYLVAAQVVEGELASLGSLKLVTARGLQNRAASVDDVRDVLGFEFDDFVGDEAFVASVDAFDFQAVENGRTGDGADCGVHAGRVTS